MSLVSNLFFLFVAVSILILYLAPQILQWIVLLIFSYLYYIAGGPRYVVFYSFSTLVKWLMALLIEKQKEKTIGCQETSDSWSDSLLSESSSTPTLQ